MTKTYCDNCEKETKRATAFTIASPVIKITEVFDICPDCVISLGINSDMTRVQLLKLLREVKGGRRSV